ncbi:17487_t:CDS:1 [Funneliformis caledonium]|uniref:17487_t:CDS:1 n=1 Tax=Funneliformis caledonium TaxID=1117310 RepID=A0A9N9BPZ3_9GLOM|nr:17487_t:CDS:1 [Funneliformis caledonium]
MQTFFAIILLLVINVAGQGHMTSPLIRIPQGDVENNLSITRSPTSSYPCGSGQNIGHVLTHYTSGQSINIKWEIGAAHEGECFVDLSTTGRDTDFKTIGSIPNCADKIGENQTNIQLPTDVTCDHCTLRFKWLAKLSGETYLNCADVSISDPQKGLNIQKTNRKRSCRSCIARGGSAK